MAGCGGRRRTRAGRAPGHRGHRGTAGAADPAGPAPAGGRAGDDRASDRPRDANGTPRDANNRPRDANDDRPRDANNRSRDANRPARGSRADELAGRAGGGHGPATADTEPGGAAGAISRAPARPDRQRIDRGRVASVGHGRRGGRGVGSTAGPARFPRRGGHGNHGRGRDRDQAGGRAARGIRGPRPGQRERANERLRGGMGPPRRRVHGPRRAAAGRGIPAGATAAVAARGAHLPKRVLARPAVHRRSRGSDAQPARDAPPWPGGPSRPAPPPAIRE